VINQTSSASNGFNFGRFAVDLWSVGQHLMPGIARLCVLCSFTGIAGSSDAESGQDAAREDEPR